MADLNIPATLVMGHYAVQGYTNLVLSTHAPRHAEVVADMFHGGRGVISGTVKEATASGEIALMRRVRLHRKSDGMVTRETWSDSNGSYYFSDIAIQPYYVTSFDHTGQHNAVIKDSIVPELMT